LPRSRRATWGLAAVLALLLAAAVAAAASWHFSSRVLVPDYSQWSEEVTIVDVKVDEIVLELEEASARPGYYGLTWDGGHAVVGPILDSDGGTVTRRLAQVHGYLLPGTDAGLEGYVFTGNPLEGRGLRFQSVPVQGELGSLPAWLIPARGGRGPDRPDVWVIVVHGHNGDRRIGLRIAPALHRAGLPALIVSYRNDLGAPPAPDGLYHLGLSEWRDLEAASRYALRHGAKRLVLVGYSMGGAIIGRYMAESPLASRTAALVLDAPVVDWRQTLAFNATEMGLPSATSLPLRWAIGVRIDADWEALDFESHLEDFRLPILLFHGTDDELVPIEGSEDLAHALPERVTYYEVSDAPHVEAWNVDPALYEERLSRFLNESLSAR
jgi:uncharacterized protein